MKIFIYILIALATGLLIFNITKVDFENPLSDDSTVAVISVLASACAVLLLVILAVSRIIASKAKRR